MNKNTIVKCKLLLIFLLMNLNNLLARDQVGIYYPSLKSAQERNSLFKQSIGDMAEPIVFAKYNDMESFIKNGGDYLVGPSYYSDYFSEYELIGKITDNRQKYLLVSLEKKPYSNLSEKVVGAVAVLDRKELKDLITKMFGSEPKRIKTVSKPDDLFNYLVLEKPNYIIVLEDVYTELVKSSKASFYIIKESSPVYEIALFVKKGGNSDKGKTLLTKIKNSNLNELGIK